MSDSKAANPGPDGPLPKAGPPTRNPWLWPAAGGLALALLALAVLLLAVRPAVERRSRPPIDPLPLQMANLALLESEIARLRDGLTLDPCAMPALPPAGPFAPAAETGSGEAREAGPESLADRVERATVMVVVESAEGVANGSGFFVASDLILTNRHVLDSLVGQVERIFVTNKALGGLIPARPVRVTGPDEARDFAILSVATPPGSAHSVLPLSPRAGRTDRVSAWGYPSLLIQTDPQLARLMEGDRAAVPEVVYSEGVISVIQDYEGVSLINHTAEVSPGNSGGPLVNDRGQAVGVNTLIRVDDESSRQVNVALSGGDVISFAAGLGLAPAER